MGFSNVVKIANPNRLDANPLTFYSAWIFLLGSWY